MHFSRDWSVRGQEMSTFYYSCCHAAYGASLVCGVIILSTRRGRQSLLTTPEGNAGALSGNEIHRSLLKDKVLHLIRQLTLQLICISFDAQLRT